MGDRIETCRKAYGLIRSDSSQDTLIAIGLLVLVFGPFLYRLYLDNRSQTSGGSSDTFEVV